MSEEPKNKPLPKGPTGMWETRGGDPNPAPPKQDKSTEKKDDESTKKPSKKAASKKKGKNPFAKKKK